MDRTTRRLFVVALVAILALTGGAALILGGGSAGPDGSLPREDAIGVIVAVDAQGLTTVTGFTLRAEGGTLLDFGLALDDPTAFPPAHLAEHQATAAPVVVTYVVRDGRNIAVAIEDWLGPSEAS